ncbi:MAG: mevalonate kinase [Myxococcota bacterium]|nr:mevalonate kinase [Myxococcota bacterium]
MPSGRSAVGRAPAKAIIVGEHFVVYGCPAVAVPIPDLVLEATLSQRDPGPPHVGHVGACLAVLHERFGGPPPTHLDVSVKSDIPQGSGLGSSAALSVALARAYLRMCGREPLDHDVREASLACERIAHRHPSGIDTEVALTGMALRFERGKPPVPVRIKGWIGLIVADTGIASATAEMVAAVAARREADRAEFDRLLHVAAQKADEAENALALGDTDSLGLVLIAGQALLDEIGVVTEEVWRVVTAAREAGALGAKVTGAGGGGAVLAVHHISSIPGIAARMRSGKVRVISAGTLGEFEPEGEP